MSFSRPFQWHHSNVDPIWPDSTFKNDPLFWLTLPSDISNSRKGFTIKNMKTFFLCSFFLISFLWGQIHVVLTIDPIYCS